MIDRYAVADAADNDRMLAIAAEASAIVDRKKERAARAPKLGELAPIPDGLTVDSHGWELAKVGGRNGPAGRRVRGVIIETDSAYQARLDAFSTAN
jgi:hypothetical protein